MPSNPPSHPSADALEAAWLIEADGPSWWTGREATGASFDTDPNEAVRFARREDADRVKHWLLRDHAFALRTTEHMWLDAALGSEGEESKPRTIRDVAFDLGNDLTRFTQREDYAPATADELDVLIRATHALHAIIVRTAALSVLGSEDEDSKHEHVCGKQGFNGMLGDACPACAALSTPGDANGHA